MKKNAKKNKKRTISIKIKTIKILDAIAEIKIKEAIENKTFDIKALVKTKRGISYDKEIKYLGEIYLILNKDMKLISSKEFKPLIKKLKIFKYMRKTKKMNLIA